MSDELKFLQFNNDKTEIMVFGPTVASSGIVKQLGPVSSNGRDQETLVLPLILCCLLISRSVLLWKAVSFN